jgi:hypothetical protein
MLIKDKKKQTIIIFFNKINLREIVFTILDHIFTIYQLLISELFN